MQAIFLSFFQQLKNSFIWEELLWMEECFEFYAVQIIQFVLFTNDYLLLPKQDYSYAGIERVQCIQWHK